MKTIKFSLILLAFMAFAQTTWAQLPCLPGHGETEDQSAWCGEIQTIALSQGVNWFSTNLEITLADLKAALTTALPEATSFNIKAKTGQFTRYNGTSWLGALRTMDVALMYKVTVPADCQITLQGEPINPAEHPITFNSKGAYWIGFPLSDSLTPANAFTGFAVSGDIVKAKNGTYTRKGGGTSWMGALKKLEPGQGYIYNSNSTATRVLTYPAPSAKQSGPSAKLSAPRKAFGHHPASSKKSINTKERHLGPSQSKASSLKMEAYPTR